MNAKLRVAAISAALIVAAGLVLLLVRPSLNPARIRPLPLLIGAWLAFITAAWLLRKVPPRTAVALILLGGILLQLAAVSAPPRNSNDLYRYIWDGRVQAAGIDPYEYVPAAAQLTGLRDQGSSGNQAPSTACRRPTSAAIRPPTSLTAARGSTGRRFRPSTRRWPRRISSACTTCRRPMTRAKPIQATTALVAVLTTVLLLFGLRRLGRDVRMAALWSWCPTVALEAGNSAHVDVVAVAIAAAAVLMLATARTTRRTVLGGILLGLAIATKLTPALTVPALLRRRWLTVAISATSAFVAVYIPHVLAVGGKVIGFLPGYLQQEGYTSGARFGIIGLFVTGRLAIVVAALIMAAAAVAVLQFSDPDRPWEGAVVMTATALAVATPHYQWYSLLLVMLVALDGRPEWLAFAAGGYYAAEPSMGRFTVPDRFHEAVAYGVPVLVVAVGWLVRHELARRGLGTTRPVPVTAGPVTAGPAAAEPVKPGRSQPGRSQRPPRLRAAKGRWRSRRTRSPRRWRRSTSPRRAPSMLSRRSRNESATEAEESGFKTAPTVLTGWLPARQSPNDTGRQDRE